MISDRLIAEHALLAYDRPTIIVGNAAARVDIVDGYSLVSIAGTDGLVDGIEDLMAIPWRPCELGGWVHAGFWRYWSKIQKPIFDQLYMNGLPVIFTGHSLGGIAACYGAACWVKRDPYEMPVVNLTTFGAPRGRSKAVVELISHVPGKRYLRDGDQVGWLGLFGWNRRNATELPGNPGPIDHPMQGYFELMPVS